jgi:hypothetical protein
MENEMKQMIDKVKNFRCVVNEREGDNKICCIFDIIENNEIMKTLKFKTSTETIRKANISLMASGINSSVRNNYNGVITTRTILNGVVQTREISKEKINEAYGKSLKEYAEKLHHNFNFLRGG